MEIRFLTLLLLGALVVSGCNKDDEFTYYWNQTACSDPWGTGDNDSNTETKTAVIKYLEGKNISVVNVSFEYDESLDTGCEACTCTTGTRIIVIVKRRDRSSMNPLGFYQ